MKTIRHGRLVVEIPEDIANTFDIEDGYDVQSGGLIIDILNETVKYYKALLEQRNGSSANP